MGPVLRLGVAAAFVAALVTPTAAGRAERVAPAALEGVVAKREVRDTMLEGDRAAPGRVETFVDAHGHRIQVGTEMPDLDLEPYAAVLAATLHSGEIERVLTEVVPWEAIGAACGHPDAIGCYSPALARIVIPDHDPADDLVHTIVHEYGHHVDRQLPNLGHLIPSCAGRADGSRNWWAARMPPQGFGCASATWDLLLGELYAEDFTAAHGIVGWQLATVGPPSAHVRRQIEFDLRNRFAPRSLGGAALVRRQRSVVWDVTVKHWTFLTARLSGPRRSNLDLYLYRRGGRRALARSVRAGSAERIVNRVLAPGRYEVRVRAARASGRASLRVALD